MRGREIDVRVLPGEAHGEPFLALALKAAAPKALAQLRWEVVAEPALGLRQELGLVGPDLLLELAQRCLARALTGVYAALRHLPGVGPIEPLGHEHLAGPVHEGDADAAAIGKGSTRFH